MEWLDKLIIACCFIALIIAGFRAYSKQATFIHQLVDHVKNLTDEIRALKKDENFPD